MEYIIIRNFEKYQHYQNRHISSWIKLYYKLIDDYKFCLLSDSSRWVMVGLMLLYGKDCTGIPLDYEFIKSKICNKATRTKSLISSINELKSIDIIYIVSTPNRIEENRIEENRQDIHGGGKKETPKKSENKISNKVLDWSFKRIWKLYPKRIGEAKAFEHYVAQVKSKDDYDLLKRAIVNYKNYLTKNKTEEKYIKRGEFWFNKVWRDWGKYTPVEKSEYEKEQEWIKNNPELARQMGKI